MFPYSVYPINVWLWKGQDGIRILRYHRSPQKKYHQCVCVPHDRYLSISIIYIIYVYMTLGDELY